MGERVTMRGVIKAGCQLSVIALLGFVASAGGGEEGRADVDASSRVTYLVDALVEARFEADWHRAQWERRLVGSQGRGGEASGEELVVAEVNLPLGLLIARGGWADGLRGGARYLVVRDGRVIGRARLVDVRRDISGAVLERRTRQTPVAGDRLVLAGMSAE